jgi:hypothetical protein
MFRSITVLILALLLFHASTVRSQTNITYGKFAGDSITTGYNNSFFGYQAGMLTTTGSDNSVFGFSAGMQMTNGINNTFFGSAAGQAQAGGYGNSYFGAMAGTSGSGDYNSFFGTGSGMNSGSTFNSFFGYSAGKANTTGEKNVFVGGNAGLTSTTGARNTFIGNFAGADKNYTGSYNTLLGASTRAVSEDVTYATAIGSGAVALWSNSITLGRSEGEDLVRIPGNLALTRLSAGGTTALCRNAFMLLATCSSSARYKSNIHAFNSGFDLLRHLRPVSFRWIDGGMQDVGLIAEEVYKVEPLLTTMNDKGEVEGVKYDRINLLLINAVIEQERRIEKLEREIKALKSKGRR